MELAVNINPLIPPNEIDVHDSNHESKCIESIVSSRDTCHHLSGTSHGSLCLDSLNQSTPLVISSHTFNSQFFGSHGNQLQGGRIT